MFLVLRLPNTGAQTGQRRPNALSRTLDAWTQKLHYYLGLYFLLFLWLFSFTGLLLNHPKWTFAQFWPNRTESIFQRNVQPPDGVSDLARARDLMRQVELSGEIEWTTQPQQPGTFAFRVLKPGRIVDVSTDLRTGLASIKKIEVNGWGVAHMLHSFTGVRANSQFNSRDWLVTSLWVFSMDALCAGLLLMVVSGYYMWYRLRTKRRAGFTVLAAGLISCGFFWVGLTWLW